MSQMYIDLGKLLAAYEQRARARQTLKSAQRGLESARQDCRMFGIYEDCGPAYEGWRDEAEGKFRQALSQKISAEKFTKKLRCEFLEKYEDAEKILTENGITTG